VLSAAPRQRLGGTPSPVPDAARLAGRSRFSEETVWDRSDANECGRANALTALTPLKWWGKHWLRLYFRARRSFPRLGDSLARPLRRLSFIHFGRWSIIDDPPPNPGAPAEELNYPYLLFESNFNGRWDQYIDAFSYVLRWRMGLIWGSSFGFPGARPAESFKAYIRSNEYDASHYYSAYPDATVNTICSALTLDEPLAELAHAALLLQPELFERRYRTFLTRFQRHL
jgi:hypothetical protein